MKIENDLGRDDIRRLVLRLAIPSMLAQFFVSQEIASYETKKALGFFERIKYIFLENIKIEVTVQ